MTTLKTISTQGISGADSSSFALDKAILTPAGLGQLVLKLTTVEEDDGWSTTRGVVLAVAANGDTFRCTDASGRELWFLDGSPARSIGAAHRKLAGSAMVNDWLDFVTADAIAA